MANNYFANDGYLLMLCCSIGIKCFILSMKNIKNILIAQTTVRGACACEVSQFTKEKKTHDYYKRLVRFNAIAGRITWFSCLLNVLIFNLLEQRKKENLMNGRCSPNRHTSERECAHTQCNLIHLKVSHLGAACIRAIRLHVCLVSNGKREAFQTSR